jgi:hypothetical protein
MNSMAPGTLWLDALACDRVLMCAAEVDFLKWCGCTYTKVVVRGTMASSC